MKRLGHGGLSMIEVLAGLSIFAVVSAGLAATTISTIHSNTTSRDLTAASTLIHDKIEQFRAMDPAANPADLTAGEHDDPANPITALGAAGGTFERYWVVTANTPKIGVSRVVVSVTFNGSAPYTMTGVTYVCRTSTCK
jgi:prepilin-type N-terminal cleavage/methylation domain-containing protein